MSGRDLYWNTTRGSVVMQAQGGTTRRTGQAFPVNPLYPRTYLGREAMPFLLYGLRVNFSNATC